MDPISAVSLAGTVIQFVDFGLKLVAKSSEIYSSVAGLEIRYTELAGITVSLVSLCRRMKTRARKAVEFAVSEDEKALDVLSTQCINLGQELVDALEKAKVHGAQKRWKSVRQAIKSILGRDRIEDIRERLSRYREQIVVLLLVITSTRQVALAQNIENLKQDVLDSEDRIIGESRKGWVQVLDTIQQRNYSFDRPSDVSAVSHLLSNTVSSSRDKKRHEAILSSLYYPRMQERREWIPAAHVKTFNWALEDKPGGRVLWDSLKDWFRTGDGIYWVSGKPGSGKSTLMKYIDFDNRTTNLLKEWAEPAPLVRSSFYFWNPGTSMQKSQLGLLQCLLFEMLTKRPSLIPKAFPSRWETSWLFDNPSFSWSEAELLSALDLLAEREFKNRFCFIIDGLDEFDGDHQKLIDVLFKITRTSNIKILVSSRPWLIFQDAFEKCPKLVLQDLTHADIRAFAHDSLSHHPRFGRLLALEPDRAPRLVTEIGDRASGVFLWVYLVVRSLLDGLTNADRISDLQRRLEQLPTDLEQYFMHMLTNLDAFYLQQASRFFRLALEARRPLSVLTFSYLDEDDPDFATKRAIEPITIEEESARCETIERRLNSRCKGLLEPRLRQACDEYSTSNGLVAEKFCFEVDFLHRTVRDFLCTPTVQLRLVAPDTDTFDANMVLAQAFVAQIKGLRCATHTESNFQSLWTLVLDALHHLSCVTNEDFSESQVALLDELDRAAAHFRQEGIVKRRCDITAHWTNTGYRFGLEPEWKNDLLTLGVQFGLSSYVTAKLTQGGSLRRTGRPLLVFAMTEAPRIDKVCDNSAQLLFSPQPSMIDLLLDKGMDSNQEWEGHSVWSLYLEVLDNPKLRATTSGPFGNEKTWFDAIKIMLCHGAHIHMHSASGKDALTIVREAFEGKSGCDISELEDIVDQRQYPDTTNDRLKVPDPAGDANRQRSTSKASARSDLSVRSDLSAASWRRPMENDIVVPLHTAEAATDLKSPSQTYQGSSQKAEPRGHSRLGSWLRRKKHTPQTMKASFST